MFKSKLNACVSTGRQGPEGAFLAPSKSGKPGSLPNRGQRNWLLKHFQKRFDVQRCCTCKEVTLHATTSCTITRPLLLPLQLVLQNKCNGKISSFKSFPECKGRYGFWGRRRRRRSNFFLHYLLFIYLKTIIWLQTSTFNQRWQTCAFKCIWSVAFLVDSFYNQK